MAKDFDLLPIESSLGIAFDLRMSREIAKEAKPDLKRSDPVPSRRLFEIHFGEDQLITYPTFTLPTDRFLTAKYRPIESIRFELSGPYDVPEDEAAAIEFLDRQLPSMFIRDPGYGLGVTTLIAPLLNVLREIPKIRYLALGSDETRVDGETFQLHYDDYEELRLAFGRIARKYQLESRLERVDYVKNGLLHRLDAERFPETGRAYVTGTIHKLLGGPGLRNTDLKGKDRVGVAQAAAANAKRLAEKEPEEFAQLQRNIELVSLDTLIARFEKLDADNAPEPRWQKLFELNPFILSMVFGYPVVLVASESPVGGVKFWGNGAKVADFLYKNDKTQNAAIVEIKRPDTELVGAEYRGGVFPPHRNLMGAITQVLDQRAKFVKALPHLKEASRYYAIEAHAVDCVIVAGRTPKDSDHRASFELFRTQMKDVRIVTFDELLAKLHLLRALLQSDALPGDGVAVRTAEDGNALDDNQSDEEEGDDASNLI